MARTASNQPKFFIVGTDVRGIYEPFRSYEGRDADGNPIYRMKYALRRFALSFRSDKPNHEMIWHSVRSRTKTCGLAKYVDELPEGAVPYAGKQLPRVSVNGWLKNKAEAEAAAALEAAPVVEVGAEPVAVFAAVEVGTDAEAAPVADALPEGICGATYFTQDGFGDCRVCRRTAGHVGGHDTLPGVRVVLLRNHGVAQLRETLHIAAGDDFDAAPPQGTPFYTVALVHGDVLTEARLFVTRAEYDASYAKINDARLQESLKRAGKRGRVVPPAQYWRTLVRRVLVFDMAGYGFRILSTCDGQTWHCHNKTRGFNQWEMVNAIARYTEDEPNSLRAEPAAEVRHVTDFACRIPEDWTMEGTRVL